MKENPPAKIIRILCFLLLLLFPIPSLLSQSQQTIPQDTRLSPPPQPNKMTSPQAIQQTTQQPAPEIQHTPITSFEYGTIISITAQMPPEVVSVLFMFRHEGIPDFQARIMEKAPDNSYFLDFDTSALP